MDGTNITATAGTKMQFLISRRPSASRDELVANWFANHMPSVIARQHQTAERSGSPVPRYVASLYNPVPSGPQVWDGVAQIWAQEAFQRERTPHGTEPRDTFQQKAMPYVGWPTTEYVVVDGEIGVTPNDLNDPYPCTRTGFLKVTTILTAAEAIDFDELRDHWLNVHAPNVASVLKQVGGMRYAISISDEPTVDPYVGMAEIYFPDKDALRNYLHIYESDGIERYFKADAPLIFRSTTEMIGIP